MSLPKEGALSSKRCVPCEGGVPRLEIAEAKSLLDQIPGWDLVESGTRIQRQWMVRNFVAGMDFLNRVAEIAEREQHHPDVALSEYRKVVIEIYTHAIGGLSENDFILAAKINEIPIALKSS
ncbi:4a-hydroxytetrahydrobiopterin dehydratase [Planctomicrobium sp. SH668]|uniref:4a-hydroxytetrahydrobiopterin dehydratase n=1 Tax=Planctomicrobium sp. SH668 TaxID=3448126 RepID=UPI003F5BE018